METNWVCLEGVGSSDMQARMDANELRADIVDHDLADGEGI